MRIAPGRTLSRLLEQGCQTPECASQTQRELSLRSSPRECFPTRGRTLLPVRVRQQGSRVAHARHTFPHSFLSSRSVTYTCPCEYSMSLPPDFFLRRWELLPPTQDPQHSSAFSP